VHDIKSRGRQWLGSGGLPTGEVELIDYKTGPAAAPECAERSLQLSIYALGCRDALGLGRPARVTLLRRRTILSLVYKATKCHDRAIEIAWITIDK
jgi:RecB family exonuclease